LAASDIQRLLSADEALVAFSVGDRESYVFALTHDGAEIPERQRWRSPFRHSRAISTTGS
jgi:hypothetical protein